MLFGATGYTGELTARALVDRGARPVLAARNARAPRRAGRRARRARDAASPTSRGPARSARSSSAATCSSRPSGRSRAGASPRSRPRSPRAPTTSTRPARRRSSARSSSATARGRRRRACGLAHRVGLRLGPGQPRRRARAARGGRAARRASTSATSSAAARARARERRHARVGRRAAARAGLRLPRRAAGHRARRRARLRGFDLGGRRAEGVTVGELRGTSRCRGCTRACATSTSTSAGSGRCRASMQAVSAGTSLLGARPGRARGRRRDRCAPLVSRARPAGPTPRRGRASGSLVVAEAFDAGGTRLARSSLEGVNPYDFTAARCWPGARRPPRTAGCRAPAPSGRSTPSGSTRSWRVRRGRHRTRLTQAALRDRARPGARGDRVERPVPRFRRIVSVLTLSTGGDRPARGPHRDMHTLIHRALSPQTISYAWLVLTVALTFALAVAQSAIAAARRCPPPACRRPRRPLGPAGARARRRGCRAAAADRGPGGSAHARGRPRARGVPRARRIRRPSRRRSGDPRAVHAAPRRRRPRRPLRRRRSARPSRPGRLPDELPGRSAPFRARPQPRLQPEPSSLGRLRALGARRRGPLPRSCPSSGRRHEPHALPSARRRLPARRPAPRRDLSPQRHARRTAATPVPSDGRTGRWWCRRAERPPPTWRAIPRCPVTSTGGAAMDGRTAERLLTRGGAGGEGPVGHTVPPCPARALGGRAAGT